MVALSKGEKLFLMPAYWQWKIDCASSITIFSVCEGNVELHGGGNFTDEIGEL